MLRKVEQKRVLQHDNAQEESSRKFEQKKSFFTRYMHRRKVTKSYTKKECASRHIGHPKKQNTKKY